MIAALYEKVTGRLSGMVQAPEIDTADYETVDIGAVEYLGESFLDMTFPWWVKIDDPLPGIVSYQKINPPLIANYYWDWSVHDYVGDVSLATTAAISRITIGRDSMMYGTFTWTTYEFLSTLAEQELIRSYALEAFISGVAFVSVDWRLADSSFVTLDSVDMLAVFSAMQANNRAAKDQYDILHEDVDDAAALTPVFDAIDALNDIVWVAP